ncbi:MAG: CDP-archaeol synthase [Alphaproteobacteria bacterium]|nr:CDP-archaeol synthase [Alphaproteobacteria bacterium]
MSNTLKRIIVGIVMLMVAGIVAMLEMRGIHAVRWVGVAISFGMIVEMVSCIRATRGDAMQKTGNAVMCGVALVYLAMMLCAIYFVGTRPWIVFLLFLVICAADVGAWIVGRAMGGDKMWERLSAGKTWAGQIAGIICGTVAAIMYGFIGTGTFMPQLMWIGISISLLSQYGDLTASWLKRRLGIKDFSNVLPGHGGLLDRFDGWIYVLPIVWMIML